MDCRMWVEGLNEKEANLSKVPLEGGSESFRDLGMVGSAERTARLKTPPCLAHSAQLLGLPPSGLLLGFSHFRAFADSHCPPSIKDPVLMLSELPSILWWHWNIGDNKFQLTCVKCSLHTRHSADIILGWFPFNSHQPHKKIHITSFYKGKKMDTERLINFFQITMNSIKTLSSENPCITETLCPSHLYAPWLVGSKKWPLSWCFE